MFEHHKRWMTRHLMTHMHIDDAEINKLGLQEGMKVADVGSGPGRYSIPMARRVGSKGIVYAIDIDEEALNMLEQSAKGEGLNNIITIRADVTHGIPLDASSVDMVLMANVLHDFHHEGLSVPVLRETYRILRSDGRLVVIERKKDAPFGPPYWLRLEPEEVNRLISSVGFKVLGLDEVNGNYIVMAIKGQRASPETR